MLRAPRTRLLFFFCSCAAIAAALLVSACTDETTDVPSDADASGDGSTRKDGSGSGGEEEDDAGGEPEKDAGITDAKPGKDANGPGEAGAECAFNRDCQLALRCECEEGNCACQPGARGTGKNGVDSCTSGNDCESSICAEGPSGSFCSDECSSNDDCTGSLPSCFPIIGIPEPICWFED